MNSPEESGGQGLGPYNPVYVHARREAVFILVLFAICLCWSVGVCWYDGYGEIPSGDYPTVWGMPRWVFWGIFLPWGFADIVTIGFCLFFMKDDDLGEAREGESLQEQIHEREEKGDHDV